LPEAAAVYKRQKAFGTEIFAILFGRRDFFGSSPQK